MQGKMSLQCISLILRTGINFNKFFSQCKWTNKRRGQEFSSDEVSGNRVNEEVTLGRTPDSTLDNMCYFTINNVAYDHNGDWECSLYAKCDNMDTETVNNDQNDFFQGRKKRQVRDRRCKAQARVYIEELIFLIT